METMMNDLVWKLCEACCDPYGLFTVAALLAVLALFAIELTSVAIGMIMKKNGNDDGEDR